MIDLVSKNYSYDVSYMCQYFGLTDHRGVFY